MRSSALKVAYLLDVMMEIQAARQMNRQNFGNWELFFRGFDDFRKVIAF